MSVGDCVFFEGKFIGRYRRKTSRGEILLEKDGNVFPFSDLSHTETEEEKDLFLDEYSSFARSDRCFFSVLYGLKFDLFFNVDREYPIYGDGCPLYVGNVVKIFVSNHVLVNFNGNLTLLRPYELKFVFAIKIRQDARFYKNLYDSAMALDINMLVTDRKGYSGTITGIILRKSDRYTPWFLFTSNGNTILCPWNAFSIQSKRVAYPMFRKYLDEEVPDLRLEVISHPYFVESTEMTWKFTLE